LTYKYAIYDGTNPNSLDNEAASGQNHFRYIRQAPNYSFPVDTFGNQYNEPIAWGSATGVNKMLTVGAPAAGHVPISWLGLPGVHLQTASKLTGSSNWVDHFETDGTNWVNGTTGINGFVSLTNYPASGGQTFFRLIKPAN
jgi:hypothetical protein